MDPLITHPPRTSRALLRRGVAATIAVAALALLATLPRALGTTWTGVAHVLGQASPSALIGLVAIWLAGLLVHVPVLRAALPGLSSSRALRLNLAGSAVSNVLPAGGAAGAGLGFAMARTWGFGSEEFASFTLISNAWNMLGRLVVGVGVVAVAGRLGVVLPHGARSTALSALVLLGVLAAAGAIALRSERSAERLATRLASAWHRGRALLGRPGPTPLPVAVVGDPWIVSARRGLLLAIRAGWLRMSGYVLGYLGLQWLLLVACLATVHAQAPLGAVAVAFGLERLITLVPVTPGSAGVAELGAVGALHLMGVDPAAAAAGVLLYRSLIYAAEIPVGGVVLLHWWRTDRRRAVVADLPEGLPTIEPAVSAA